MSRGRFGTPARPPAAEPLAGSAWRARIIAAGVATLAVAVASLSPVGPTTAATRLPTNTVAAGGSGSGSGNCDEFMCGTNHNQARLR